MPARSSSELIAAIDQAVSKVRTRSLDVSFNELADMYENKELKIRPEFQRLFRWPISKRSQFVESLVLELPVPPIYVIETDEGVYELIDGLQRISSYLHFRGLLEPREDEDKVLKLEGCDIVPELNGQTFEDLPQAIKIKLKRHFIRMEVLRRESDRRLTYYMFKRLNTGGEILSQQEVRNATIRLLDDSINTFLKKMAENQDYRTCMSGLTQEKIDQMYMEEYVLRYFAMKNNRDAYHKDIGEFLTAYMEGVAEGVVAFDYLAEERAFAETFGVLNSMFQDAAFSGVNKRGNPQGYFSSLLFEAIALGIQRQLQAIVASSEEVRGRVAEGINSLRRDDEFQKATKGGGRNYSAALRQRIKMVEDKVAECL